MNWSLMKNVKRQRREPVLARLFPQPIVILHLPPIPIPVPVTRRSTLEVGDHISASRVAERHPSGQLLIGTQSANPDRAASLPAALFRRIQLNEIDSRA